MLIKESQVTKQKPKSTVIETDLTTLDDEAFDKYIEQMRFELIFELEN